MIKYTSYNLFKYIIDYQNRKPIKVPKTLDYLIPFSICYKRQFKYYKIFFLTIAKIERGS
jgi:hypothetical protein